MSFKSCIRSLLVALLIAFGPAFISTALLLSMSGSPTLSVIATIMGVVIGTSGWILRKSKKPMSLIRYVFSGILLTIGMGVMIFSPLILIVKGTNTAFQNIALMNFVVGLIVGLIGLSARNQRSK
ncbi:MAG: hypothetical protein AUK48_03310 [Oscillatoriales cyanobacterium CG2_30_44_21]|nr:MAG: hypothetical protein AUK48_03310 [Oscillatoriales cyanobacterium CG2_30_44_21]